MTQKLQLALFIIALLVDVSQASFFPKLVPKSFEQDQLMPIFASPLKSGRTNLDFKYESLPLCSPLQDISDIFQKHKINLRGDVKDETPYFVYMNNNADMLDICTANYTADDYKHMIELIEGQYKYDMYLDGLAAIVQNQWYVPTKSFYTNQGVPVGRKQKSENQYMYYNHFKVDIEINPDMDNEHYFRVVGFEVEPLSCGGIKEYDEEETEDETDFEGDEESQVDKDDFRLLQDEVEAESEDIDDTTQEDVDSETSEAMDSIGNTTNTGLYQSMIDKIQQFENVGDLIPGQGQRREHKGYDICLSSREANPLYLNPEGGSITYTYTVNFYPSSNPWAHRWDQYMTQGKHKVHYLYIGASMGIVLLGAIVIRSIIGFSVSNDVENFELIRLKKKKKIQQAKENKARPNSSQYSGVQQTDEEGNEMSNMDHVIKDLSEIYDHHGWKSLKGDVFRAPQLPLLFSCLIGTGIQIFLCVTITLIIAFVSVQNPEQRNSLFRVAFSSFILMSFVGGYFSARTFKMFKGTSWALLSIVQSMLYPSFIFGIIVVTCIFNRSEIRQGYIPFHTAIIMAFIHIGISVPMSWLGSFYGFKRESWKLPGKVNMLEKAIPEGTPWSQRYIFMIILGGFVPFAGIVVQVYFLLESTFRDEFYVQYGVLFLMIVILLLTAGEITVVQTYLQLNAGNHAWWWNAFVTGAATGVWVFAFSMGYYIFVLTSSKGLVSFLSYFITVFTASFTISILTGTFGVVASYYFNKKIFSILKSD